MSTRKRSIQDIADDYEDEGQVTLRRIRSMWHFANLCQWIYIFGEAARIDASLDIEEIEAECLKPNSPILTDVALALLKLVSAHRGLTYEIFDEQLQKQYSTRTADHNPFTDGDGDAPLKFAELDIFTKIRILQQLTQWIMMYPQRLRDRMEEQKDSEQTNWRIEPYGWDELDRTYYVLDDNRVYRLSDPPPRRSKPKNMKRARTGRQSRNRPADSPTNPDAQSPSTYKLKTEPDLTQDGLGGMEWECVAVTLGDVRHLVDGLAKTRDENEKVLRNQLKLHLLPILEKHEESRKRREVQRERELANLAKMANAKRSSRIANKVEQQKQEDQERDEEKHTRHTEATRRREEQARLDLERERHIRMVSRDQRLQEREARRRMHEEELVQLSEGENNALPGAKRISERHLQTQIERTQQALQEIEQEQEDWMFDCVCGVHGQIDDGTHSVACEKCSIWQHSRCVDVDEEEADRPEFQFLCTSCRHNEIAMTTPKKTKIKLRVSHPSRVESEAGLPCQTLLGFANTTASEVALQGSASLPQCRKENNSSPAQPDTVVNHSTQTSPPTPSPSAQSLVFAVASTSQIQCLDSPLETRMPIKLDESTRNLPDEGPDYVLPGKQEAPRLSKPADAHSVATLSPDAEDTSAVTATSKHQLDCKPAAGYSQEPQYANHAVFGTGIS